jgi:hypothetical protein
MIFEGSCLGSAFEVEVPCASIGIALLAEILTALHLEDDEDIPLRGLAAATKITFELV